MIVTFNKEFLKEESGFVNSVEFKPTVPAFTATRFINTDSTAFTGISSTSFMSRHIAEKLCDLFEAYKQKSLKFTCLKGVTETSGKSIEYVTLDNTIYTKPIFELFRSIGMTKATIRIGVAIESGEIKTLYLENYILKTLREIQEVYKVYVVGIMLSIYKFLSELNNTRKIPMEFSEATKNTVVISKEIEDYVYKINEEKSIEIVELSYESLTKVLVRYDPSSSIANSASISKFAYTYSFLKTTNLKNENKWFILFSRVLPFDSKYMIFAYDVESNIGVSLQKESMLDLETSSWLYAMAVMLKDTVGVVYEKTFDNIFKKTKSIEYYATLDEIEMDATIPEAMKQKIENLRDYMSSSTTTKTELNDDASENVKTFMVKEYKVLFEGAAVESFDSVKDSYDNDEYAQQLYKQVQPYYNTFDLKTLNYNIPGFVKGTIYSMLFTGSSGTGKSTAARVFAAKCGFPYLSVNLSQNIEEADLFGTMIPNPCKASPEDPEFIWQDGVITVAVRKGYVVILEEVNFARPGVLGKLNSLLDENRQIDLSNGEILQAHKNFRIIGTCNIAYEGTNRFNKAFLNRFNDCTVFKDLTKDEIVKIIMERTGYKHFKNIDTVYAVYSAVQKYSNDNKLDLVISLRQLLNIFTMGKYYINAGEAVERIMLNAAFIEDEERFAEFKQTVLPSFPLKFKI